MNKIAVIVLNWNGLEDTVECINSLLTQSHKDYEVFLIDNKSEGNDFKILTEKFGDKVRLSLNEANLGFTKAHNQIFKEIISQGGFDYLALLNNDAVADKNWLERLVSCALEEKCDLVSSKLIKYNDHSKIDNTGLIVLNTGEIFPYNEFENSDGFNSRLRVCAASGAACLYSTKLMESIGFFDEYFVNGYEDSEFGLRANLFGYKVVYEPKAIVYHKGSVSVNKIRGHETSLKLQKDILYTYLKLTPFPVILLNLLFIIIKYIDLTLFSIITFRFEFLKILYVSIFEVLSEDLGLVLYERKKTMRLRKISVIEFLKLQKFFASYYWKYFKHGFVQGDDKVSAKIMGS